MIHIASLSAHAGVSIQFTGTIIPGGRREWRSFRRRDI